MVKHKQTGRPPTRKKYTKYTKWGPLKNPHSYDLLTCSTKKLRAAKTLRDEHDGVDDGQERVAKEEGKRGGQKQSLNEKRRE